MRIALCTLGFYLLLSSTHGQSFWDIPDTFNQNRFWTATAAGTVMYGVALVSLNEAWYKEYPRSSFHFFDDWNEWRNLDKLGHVYTGYFESYLIFRGALWTGMTRKSAAWTGFGVGLFLQTTVEMLDGFSSQWGFSIYDFGANVIGSGSFLAQELLWNEQRLFWKVSANFPTYSSNPIPSAEGNFSTSLEERADDLFGTSKLERLLKDYNAQTIWLSGNISSLLKSNTIPKWLNLSIGFGAENLFGGFSNVWTTDSHTYQLDPQLYNRSTQIYFAPDIDLSRVKTGSRFINSLFDVLNIFKFPTPSVEWHLGEGIKWHWIYF